MLPTPAPTTPGNSPPLQKTQLPETEIPDYKLPDNAYPEAPQNRGTTPFSVLSGLFDKLQTERKPEKRRRFLSAWFDVRLHVIHGKSFSSDAVCLALA
jgi:DNA ligase 4